jgi:hypothetical protein
MRLVVQAEVDPSSVTFAPRGRQPSLEVAAKPDRGDDAAPARIATMPVVVVCRGRHRSD